MRKLLAMVLLLFWLGSCEKDKTSSPIWEYMPLEEGSFWTYRTLTVDSNGQETHLSDDTLWLQSLEVVGEHRLASFKGSGNFLFQSMLPPFDLRDSSGLLISSSGDVQLSLNEGQHQALIRTHELEANLGRIDTRLLTTPISIEVPFGRFSCIGTSQTIELTDAMHMSHQRIMYRYYGQGAGIVKATSFFINSSQTIETRLTGYYHQ